MSVWTDKVEHDSLRDWLDQIRESRSQGHHLSLMDDMGAMYLGFCDTNTKVWHRLPLRVLKQDSHLLTPKQRELFKSHRGRFAMLRGEL